METRHLFEEMERTIEKSDMIVLRDIHGFPVYGKNIISPYMMLCINHSGSARVLYDMQEIEFQPNEIAVVMPNHILRPIESSDDYRVTILVHSVSLCEELKTKRLTHDYHKFHLVPACLLTDEDMALFMKAVELLEHICQSSTQHYPLRREMLIQLTNVMTEMLNAYRREMDDKVNDSRNHSIFNTFCDLLAIHYHEQHEVAFYAEKAHITTRHLSIIIKDIAGLSASDYIEQYILTHARNLLLTRPDLSVRQISYHIGFSESPSFCRFFKRLTGKTPKNFRQTIMQAKGQ